ncbi:MAG: hypothetical protein U9R75_06795, partial [Candidatus Thermoplasmatota archaeon]|nr:hypothetical protein [Candidatus Thermoplasmatota archaeon]
VTFVRVENYSEWYLPYSHQRKKEVKAMVKEGEGQTKLTEVSTKEISPRETEEFTFLDGKDETQIVEEMRGTIITEYVYIICRKHRSGQVCSCGIKDKIVSLSYAGVKRLIHLRGDISIHLEQFVESDTGYYAIFKANDNKRNIEVYGGAQQSKKSSEYGGKLTTDPFAVAKCISKAQRNAWRNLIPEADITFMIKEKLEQEGAVLVSSRLAGQKPGTIVPSKKSKE